MLIAVEYLGNPERTINYNYSIKVEFTHIDFHFFGGI